MIDGIYSLTGGEQTRSGSGKIGQNSGSGPPAPVHSTIRLFGYPIVHSAADLPHRRENCLALDRYNNK